MLFIVVGVARAKGKTLSFPLSEIVSHASLDLVHTDVWDCAHIISHHGYKYLNTFNDDFSSYTWVYFLILMLMSFAYLKEFVSLLEKKFSITMSTSAQFQSFLKDKGLNLNVLVKPITKWGS